MTLPKLKPCYRQPFLFDEPLRGHGHVRTVIGDTVERLVAKAVRGRIFNTQGNVTYCPDVVSGRMFFECKAAGRSRQFFIYAGRLEKDRRFAEENMLWYAVWHHRVDTKTCRTVAELERSIEDGIRSRYLIPFREVSRLCVREEKLNSAYGNSGHKLYGSGFRLSLRDFAHWLI